MQRGLVLAWLLFGSEARPGKDEKVLVHRVAAFYIFHFWILYGLGLMHLVCCLQADIVFWLGDLNYRISEEVPDEQVFEMLKNNDLDTLRQVLKLYRARSIISYVVVVFRWRLQFFLRAMGHVRWIHSLYPTHKRSAGMNEISRQQ